MILKKLCVTCNGNGVVLIHDYLICECSDCNGSGEEPCRGECLVFELTTKE